MPPHLLLPLLLQVTLLLLLLLTPLQNLSRLATAYTDLWAMLLAHR